MKEHTKKVIEDIILGEFDINLDDICKDMAVGQGYVPKSCRIPGQLIMALINERKNPCEGCNLGTREKCKADN